MGMVFVFSSLSEVATVCRAEGLFEAVARVYRDVLGIDFAEFPTE